MRKPRSFLLGEAGRTNIYHVVTRTAAREILFGDAERETFRKILFKQLKFSGLRCLAWCFMGIEEIETNIRIFHLARADKFLHQLIEIVT